MIGFAMCGSYCTHRISLQILRNLCSKHEILPIMSENVYSTDTRFGRAAALIGEVEGLCGRKTVHTIAEAEPIGPSVELECLVICPCTGNTLAKIATGITDTAVTMAAKAQLRSNRPLLIALASNDAMSANLSNIGILLNRKNVYFAPMFQDDPSRKPHSLVADFSKVEQALNASKISSQLRPLFLH